MCWISTTSSWSLATGRGLRFKALVWENVETIRAYLAPAMVGPSARHWRLACSSVSARLAALVRTSLMPGGGSLGVVGRLMFPGTPIQSPLRPNLCR